MSILSGVEDIGAASAVPEPKSAPLSRLGDLPRNEQKRCQYDENVLSGPNLTCPHCRRSYADCFVAEAK